MHARHDNERKVGIIAGDHPWVAALQETTGVDAYAGVCGSSRGKA